MARAGLTFTSWLHRPYVDLGPMPVDAPAYTSALDVDRRNFVESQDFPMFWQTISPSFRDELFQDGGLSEHNVRTPPDLPVHLRTPDWQMLCDHITQFNDLTTKQQVRLARLLNKLGFFHTVRELIPVDIYAHVHKGEDLAGLSWLRSFAGYRLALEGSDSSYRLEEFETLAVNAPIGLWKIAAHYQMVVQNVKHQGNLAATEHWQGLHADVIEKTRPELEHHDYLMAISRSHRVGAFIPQMKRDRVGTSREMDLASQYAKQADYGSEIQRLYAREIAWPVRESRIKEALWAEDLDTALARAEAHCEAGPLDSRCWNNCGEVHLERNEPEEALAAYLEAARLTPPGGAMIHFMVGHCYEVLGQLDAALDRYLLSLKIDPYAVSSAKAAMHLTESLGSRIKIWLQNQVQELTELGEQADVKDAGYRRLPPPEPQTT